MDHLIESLETQIKQEISRLEQASFLNWEKEAQKLRVYEELTKQILENYV